MYTQKNWNVIATNVSKIENKELREEILEFCLKNFPLVNPNFQQGRFEEYVNNKVFEKENL